MARQANAFNQGFKITQLAQQINQLQYQMQQLQQEKASWNLEIERCHDSYGEGYDISPKYIRSCQSAVNKIEKEYAKCYRKLNELQAKYQQLCNGYTGCLRV